VPSPVGIADWKAYTSRFGSDTLTVVHLATQASEKERSIPLGQICPSDLVILVSINLLSRLWSYKKEWLDEDVSIPQSLSPFDLEYSVMIFDEIHLAKSMGLLQTACHQLAKRVAFKIGRSATPLINSPLDLCFVTNASNFPRGIDVGNVDIPTTSPEDAEPRTIPNLFKEARMHPGRQRRLDRTSMSHIIPILYNAVEEDDPGRSDRPPLFLSSALDKRQILAAASEVIPHRIQLEGDYRRAAQNVFDHMGLCLPKPKFSVVHLWRVLR
jgi:hypothetical protein